MAAQQRRALLQDVERHRRWPLDALKVGDVDAGGPRFDAFDGVDLEELHHVLTEARDLTQMVGFRQH